jgi:hypothetical protein
MRRGAPWRAGELPRPLRARVWQLRYLPVVASRLTVGELRDCPPRAGDWRMLSSPPRGSQTSTLGGFRFRLRIGPQPHSDAVSEVRCRSCR